MHIAKRMYFTTASWRSIIGYVTQDSICTSRIHLNEKCQNVLVAVKIVHYQMGLLESLPETYTWRTKERL